MSSLKIIATSSLCFIIIAIVAIVIVTTNVTPATTTTETPTTTTDIMPKNLKDIEQQIFYSSNPTAFSQLGPSMARMIRNGGLKISEASRSIIEKKFEESRELGAKDKEKITRFTSDRRTRTEMEKMMLGKLGEPMDVNFATATVG